MSKNEKKIITLTVNEAKTVYRCVEHEYLRMVLERAPGELIAHIETVMYTLREKIEQSESKDG